MVAGAAVATRTSAPLSPGYRVRSHPAVALACGLLGRVKPMKYSPSLLVSLSLSLGLAACGDGDGIAASELDPPTTPDEVEDVYESLGTCNDSFLTRSLTPRPEILATTLWSPPPAAPAGLLSWRTSSGWNRLVLANELTFDGVGEDVTSPDPACAAVQRLLTPYRAPGSARDQFAHVLLYLDEAAHPYTAYPEAGIEARRAPSAASLVSYLNVVFAERVVSSGAVELRDVTEQHLPLYVSCAKPFEIETRSAMFDDLEITGIDPAMCDEGVDLDEDGDLDHRCVTERGLHVDDNTCTFVVDASTLVTLDGKRQPAIFGGTITTRGRGEALAYEITVDRFSR